MSFARVCFLGTGWLLCVALLSCVSRSGPSQRFVESSALTAPVTNIAVTDPNNFSFAAVGDLHIGGGGTSRLTNILQQADAQGAEFSILLGDIVDKGAEIDFAAVDTAANALGYAARLVTVVGNHDIFYDGWTHWKQHWGPSHYRVTVGNARFFILDTADGTLGEDQMDWLEAQLAQPWTGHTFLCSHYGPDAPNYLRLANADEAVQFMAVAKKYGVTASLAAHYHSYLKKQISGVDYVIAGGGGGKRMDPIHDFFFVLVKVNGSTVTYELKIVN